MTDALDPLRQWRQWIVVKLAPTPSGKIDKLPIDTRTGLVTAKGSGGAHNPEVWLPHDHAATIARMMGPDYTVGFVITAHDPFWCLDIDGALTPQGWSPLAQQLCAALPGTAVEVSLSGTGLHIWGQGPVPAHSMKRVDLGLEFYSELRFIALGRPGATGDMSQPCPTVANVVTTIFPPRVGESNLSVLSEGPRTDWRGPTDDADLLRRALQSSSAGNVFGGKASFADLWDANVDALSRAYPSATGEPYDRSSADAALAQHLAFWTGCDQQRIASLMQGSKLKREKWDREDYLPRTIGNACGMQTDVLQDKPAQFEIERAATPSALAAPPSPTQAPAVAPNPAPAASGQSGIVEVQGATFLSPAAQAKLFEGCVYVTELHRVLVPGGKLLKPDNFRAAFGGYTFAMDAVNERTTRNAWEAFTESQAFRAPRADNVCFFPTKPYGTMIHDAGRVRVNQWWPIDTPRKKGDPARFLTHLRKLLPNERDALIVLSYMAACVQHVGVKFQWAPLIQGVEGNGKTFLSRCVAEAIGRRYVHWPKASKVAKQFNGWLAGHVFYAVEDIHTTENVDVIEELKPMITGGDGIEIERKGVDQISTEICGNFLFNSNHKSGLRKTRNDRRLAVFFSAQQSIDDLIRDGMTGDYMHDLYDWATRQDGYAVVTDFLKSYEIPWEFNPAGGCQRAPVTSTTNEAIFASLGRIEQELVEAIEQGVPGFAGGWVSTVAFDRLLERMGRVGAISHQKRGDILKELGYVKHPGLIDGRTVAIVLPDGAKPRLYIRRDSGLESITGAAEIGRAYSIAQGVK